MSDAILFNGEAGEPELALHRGFNYGDGVFRTCLIHGSRVVDLDRQVEKLLGDAAALELDGPPREMLELDARALASGQARGVLKMMLVRGGGERGYRSQSRRADRLLCRYSAPSFPEANWEQGIAVARVGWRLAAQPAFAGIKHLNRLEQVLAARKVPSDAVEGLLGDAEDAPICGTRTNLFWVERGVLRTPALDRCGVAGLMREKVLEAAQALGIETRIASGRWEELEAAAEAFVTNSLVGVWPLARLAGRRWPGPGAVTRALSARLAHPRLAGS